nr:MAG TPA: hypothetical protein [Caudoviricetes sp.]
MEVIILEFTDVVLSVIVMVSDFILAYVDCVSNILDSTFILIG